MTSARFRRRRRAMVQKDTATDVEISRRFNELRRELLDDRAKTINWWLGGAAIFLSLFGIVAVIAGYFSFERFREIETEAIEYMESSRKHAEDARNLVGEIKADREQAALLVEGLTAKTANDNPSKARKAAESVQEDPSATPISQAIAAALLLQQQGNIEKAIEKWRAIANVMDGINKEAGARAWFSIGYLLYNNKRNDLETVIDAYNEAIRLKPDYVEAYNNRGTVKSDLGQHKEAIADYDEAIRQIPNFLEAYYNRGNSKKDIGRHEEAIADYDQAIRLNSNFSAAYNNRGFVKHSLGRYEEAIADYDQAIRLNSNFSAAYNNRGFVKHSLGRYEEAIADYDQAVRLNSNDAAAYNNRGLVKHNLGRYEEAIADYDRV